MSNQSEKQDSRNDHDSKVELVAVPLGVHSFAFQDTDSDKLADDHQSDDQNCFHKNGQNRGYSCAHGEFSKKESILSALLAVTSSGLFNFVFGLLFGMYLMQSALLDASVQVLEQGCVK